MIDVVPELTSIDRALSWLQGAGPHPTYRLGTRRPAGTHCGFFLQWVVAVSPPGADSTARRRPQAAGTRLAGAEQGRPVLDEAAGAAEPAGGEGRRISDGAK